MEYLILGPVEVRNGERVVTIQRRSRALLALLLLRAGEVVSTDVLIEGIWATPPRTARQGLHNCVAQLRSELGDHVIEMRDAAYLLRIEPGQLDLARFERLVAEARETESPEKRALRLREALSLWRGPPLGDLDDEPFARAEIPRLEELHRVTRQDLIDAQLELGRHTDVVGELESLVGEHPFDERLRGQLMLALYRSGRQADSLAAYQDARRALVDNLGLEPGAALRELEQAILRQDPSLDLPAVIPSLEERRKTVTVLSCEVSPVTSGLDPEELRRSTVKALSTVRAAIDANGGTVESVGGDELFGVFGVPAAHEDDALRAVRAASALREEETRRCRYPHRYRHRRGPGRSRLRVGRRRQPGETAPTRIGSRRHPARRGDARALPQCRSVRPTKGAFRLLGTETGTRPITRGPDAPLVGRKRRVAALRRAYEEARKAFAPA